MRKATTTIGAAAALGLTTLAPLAASAGPAAITPVASDSGVHTVQYWGSGPRSYDDGWERRQWREGRRERDEARVAEAARREAWRIEQEREQRRAWWRAERDRQYGHGPGYYRSW